MGKNNKNKKNKNKKPSGSGPHVMTEYQTEEYKKRYPFVSVCTPTYNRRPFIEGMLKCFNHQLYPKDRMEWIIIDDGTDKIEDLVINHPNVKYFKYDEKLKLGKKRNLLHEKSCGEILVYMDDDDYYPPERINHAVNRLMSDEKALCAGSSEIYIYFKHIEKMYQFGPYSPTHATAGTFAFKRKLIEDSRYEDDACLAEEKAFLKNYTIPFVQLDPIKTILVFSHKHNTFDKKRLLENPHPTLVKQSNKTINMFVKESDLKKYYMNIDEVLENYSPGEPKMKPDVLEQMIKIEETRRKQAEQMLAQNGGGGFQITIEQNGRKTPLNIQQVVELLKKQQDGLQQQGGQMTQLKSVLDQMSKEIGSLKNEIGSLKNEIVSKNNEINMLKIEKEELTKQNESLNEKINNPSSEYWTTFKTDRDRD